MSKYGGNIGGGGGSSGGVTIWAPGAPPETGNAADDEMGSLPASIGAYGTNLALATYALDTARKALRVTVPQTPGSKLGGAWWPIAYAGGDSYIVTAEIHMGWGGSTGGGSISQGRFGLGLDSTDVVVVGGTSRAAAGAVSLNTGRWTDGGFTAVIGNSENAFGGQRVFVRFAVDITGRTIGCLISGDGIEWIEKFQTTLTAQYGSDVVPDRVVVALYNTSQPRECYISASHVRYESWDESDDGARVVHGRFLDATAL